MTDTPLRVLLVEDSDEDAALVLRELERGGYATSSRRVDTAAGLADALAKGPWDLVIADYTMPDFGGEKPLAMVRESGLDLPFICVSGTLGEEAALNAIRHGAQDYVLKGDLKGLLPAVERELREVRLRRERALSDEGLGKDRFDLEQLFRERTAALVAEKAALEEESRRLREELRRPVEGTFPPPLPVVRPAPSRRPKILLVDDLPENLLALEAILENLEAEIVKASSGEEALRHIFDQDFAVILLDVRMPGMGGVDTAMFIRKRERSRHTPIIFLTANYDSPEEVVRGYAVGAVDYITKPFIPEVLRAKVAVFLELFRKNEELRRHARACEELSRELDTFSSSVAHDLRAPLRAIEGFSRSVVEDYGETLQPGAKGYLDRVTGAARRMDALIQNLLAYAHVTRQELRLAEIDLSSLLGGIASEWEEAIQAKHADFALEPPFPSALGHELTLRQVVSNLLGNALKFTRKDVSPRVRIRAESRAEFVRVVVEDNGIGISTQDQKRLFRPFERLHSQDRYEGTGMGLAIVRRAMEKMGGTVGVESEPGRGSRFFVELRAST